MTNAITGNKFTLTMTIAVLAGFSIIILLNIASMFGIIPPKYISQNDVRGMAVEYNNTLFTLNFDQQNTLIDIFNRSIEVDKETIKSRAANVKNPTKITKIIIYRFNQPDIEIIPVGYVNKSQSAIAFKEQSEGNLVFKAPTWVKDGFLEEAASDELHKILLTTYDP